MTQETRSPTSGARVQGFDLGMVSDAVSELEHTAPKTSYQDPVLWIARRARISIPRAAVIVELNHLGARS